ncbi:MAG: hypothetical protein RLZZ34_2609 [Verrucomicrobiota bacterium]
MSGRVLNAGNGVRERFPILTQARECQFVLFNPFAWVYPGGRSPFNRVLAERSGASKTENRFLTPFPTASPSADRMLLRILRQGLTLGGAAFQKSRQGKIRLR